ncbi:MAG: MgtC/SapB family protein [Brevinema sp.]
MSAHIEILLRFTFAIFSGVIVGLERKQRGKPAGIMTNTLVCLGATILAVFQQIISTGIQVYGFSLPVEGGMGSDGRIIAQIVSGIGFLGAGTIIRDKTHVLGITTAAMLWIMACLGIVIGYGYWFLSFSSFIVIIFVIFVLKAFNTKFIEHKNSVTIVITCESSVDIYALFEEYNLSIYRYAILKIQRKDSKLIRTIRIRTYLPPYVDIKQMMGDLSQKQEILYSTYKNS